MPWQCMFAISTFMIQSPASSLERYFDDSKKTEKKFLKNKTEKQQIEFLLLMTQ